MQRFSLLSLAVLLPLVGLAASAGSVSAADDLDLAPEVTISPDEETGGGLYLRGDVGYTLARHSGDVEFTIGGFDGAFDDSRFGRPLAGSIGLGTSLSDILRTDVTAEYFQGRFDGDVDVATPCAGQPAGTGCSTAVDADYKALSLMANAYVDLATIAGVTPYLGAGLGATYLDWSSVEARARCGSGPCPGTGAVETGYRGQDDWRFTYALMAGASYDVSDRVKLDVNYRYSDIAGGGFAKGSGVDAEDDGFSRHEIRAGLRFSLN
ncbi:outer membrane protein [Rhizobium sp. CC-YZS058]|uniref:outer membrane protein n=1 Tax=Rhizobium sp. CC-YZS058 TaxID=3042153 RepID=UPI002B05F831|nr:outer membrane protein [Rhizobium sp. CC-YZS058]MEA3533661.1 outer membrane protein [Rhizobium sp. CC-YZS058]